jgi:hypothetical protein
MDFSFWQNVRKKGDPSKFGMGIQLFISSNQGCCSNYIAHGAQLDDQNALLNGGVGSTVFAVKALFFVGFARNVA